MTAPQSKIENRKLKMILIIVFAALLAGAAMYWRLRVQTYHFAAVQENVLYRSGNRGARELATACRKAKVKTIVTLVDDRELTSEPFADEATFAETSGIKVIRLPIPLGGWPTEDDVKKFLNIARDSSNQPVLVHCAQGVRRTGFLVAAYQRAAMNFDREKAKANMLTFGHSRRTVGDIEKFVEVYDPATGAVPTSMPISPE